MMTDGQPFSLYRWDELELEKVTEMISRKIVTGAREMIAQIYLKKGAVVPMHSHESEQMTYVLQGALKFLQMYCAGYVQNQALREIQKDLHKILACCFIEFRQGNC